MSPNDLKKGTVIRFEGELWITVEFQRVSPGKGSSFVRTKIRNLKNGKIVEHNFKASESLDFEEVQYAKMQYLYNDGTLFTFMNNNTYEQIQLGAADIGDDVKFLKEGIEVTIVMFEDQALTVQMPKKIEYVVKTTEPAVKGDTAAGNVTKEAIMDNGLVVKVPIFIAEGETIMVNTEDSSYSERVQK